jgi:salicylate hydroxylase
MTPTNVVIVGGGIGGMTAALALSQAGFSVRLYEQAPQFGEIGAGIMLTPNATRVLVHLGLGEALANKAMRPPASIYRRFDDASLVGDAPLGETIETQYGAPYFHIHRTDLLDILTAAVRSQNNAELYTDHRAVDCGRDKASAVVNFANGTAVSCDLLLACDGVRSTLRACVLDAAEPRFRGQVAWRGLVPASGLPESVAAKASVVWIGPDRHIVQYLVRGGTLVNYVAIAAKHEWEEEGWNRPSTVSEVCQEFAGWHDDILALLGATPADALYKWGLFDRDPLDCWVFGRIALLGDAAHPMLPFMAQGAAMAIEDAMILARSLQAADSVEAALDQYQTTRRDRTAQIIMGSRGQTNLYQKLTGDKTQQRAQSLDLVYGYDAVTGQLGIGG